MTPDCFIYKDRQLVLICSACDWRHFLPGVRDENFRWAGMDDSHMYKWTWRWDFESKVKFT